MPLPFFMYRQIRVCRLEYLINIVGATIGRPQKFCLIQRTKKRTVEDARPYDPDWINFVGEHIMFPSEFAQNPREPKRLPYIHDLNRLLYFSVADPQLFNIISYLLSAKVKTFAQQPRIHPIKYLPE